MTTKETNPKDAVGVSKWRQFCTVPLFVIWEVGVGMLEGARKYGRHNYRKAGVRASVYVDAAKGHIDQWWEGEDTDADSGLSHITKAICSLVVLRDAMINEMWTDDRPPKGKLDETRAFLQKQVEAIMERYPDAREPFTQAAHGSVGMDMPDEPGMLITPAEIDRAAVVDREVGAARARIVGKAVVDPYPFPERVKGETTYLGVTERQYDWARKRVQIDLSGVTEDRDHWEKMKLRGWLISAGWITPV